MPTRPIEEFIPRSIEVKLQKILDQFSALIEETVNFGSHIFKWSLNSVNGGVEYIPVFLSFRNIFELLDVISVLIKYSCCDPCKILLRSIFESTLAIEYILEKDTKQRGMDFMAWYYNQELKIHRRHDPDDQMYKEFRKNMENDKMLKDWKLPEFPTIKEEIERLKNILNSKSYKESKKEFNLLKKKGITNPRWYELHNGPRNIEKLADYLHRSRFYQILYRHWSPAVHGTDLIRNKISLDDAGHVYIWQIRSPKKAQEITKYSISFALMNINVFIDFFKPEKKEELANWYINEIHDSYLELTSKDIIEVK